MSDQSENGANSKIIDFNKGGARPSNDNIKKTNPAKDNIYAEMFKVTDIDAMVIKLNDKAKFAFKKAVELNPKASGMYRPALTTTNYLPDEMGVLLKGIAFIKVFDIVNKELAHVFKTNTFVLSIAGYGSGVKPIYDIGDFVDIRQSSAMAHRPMFYNENSSHLWKEHLKNNKSLIMVGRFSDKDNATRVLSGSSLPDIKDQLESGIFTGQETVEVHEYFITETHNITGIYGV